MPEQRIKTVFPGESHPTSCQQGLLWKSPAEAQRAASSTNPRARSPQCHQCWPWPGGAWLAATVSPQRAQRSCGVGSSCSVLLPGQGGAPALPRWEAQPGLDPSVGRSPWYARSLREQLGQQSCSWAGRAFPLQRDELSPAQQAQGTPAPGSTAEVKPWSQATPSWAPCLRCAGAEQPLNSLQGEAAGSTCAHS